MEKTNNSIVEYETDAGKVKLSPETVKRYLVSGDPSKVTDQEVMMFIALCKYQKLNPFLREAYLIKYGDEPATIVTGKETFTKRAAKNELCAGWQAGVIVIDKNGKIQQRNGTLVLSGETLVGGWAKVTRKDWKEPLEITVSLSEYIRYRKDGQPTRNWKDMPATMIRKVALVQALREAFPEDFQGMYSPEEMPIDDSQLPEKPVEGTVIDVESEEKQENLATDAQRKKLYTLATKLGFSKETMHALMEERYGKQSSKELTKEEASDLIEYLLEIEKHAEQSKQQEAGGENVQGA